MIVALLSVGVFIAFCVWADRSARLGRIRFATGLLITGFGLGITIQVVPCILGGNP